MSFLTVAAIGVGTVLGSIGVNTHLDFHDPGYQNPAVTEAAIRYLGIKNLRDSAEVPGDLLTWPAVAAATGARFDDYMGEGEPALDVADLAYAVVLAGNKGVLNFIEGGDENDDPYAISKGNSFAWTAAFQRQVFSTGRALGLPVINMSFGAGWTSLNNWRGDYDKVGDLSRYADYANAHTYPTVGSTPNAAILRLNADAKLAARSRPVITTEIGWDTAHADPGIVARYALDAVFDCIKSGNARMYFYALFDDGSGKFGLMNQDGTPKPAGKALHNLMVILADKGTARRGSLGYGLTGVNAGDSTLLMRKSTGAFELAVWNETTAAHTVTLSLAKPARKLTLYDPLTGPRATRSSANAGSFGFRVSDHPVIVEIVP